MPRSESLALQWKVLRAKLNAALKDGYSHLEKVSKKATKTFEDRIKKVDGPLARTLENCGRSALLNAKLAAKHRQFCSSQLKKVDAVVKTVSGQPAQTTRHPKSPAGVANVNAVVVAPLFASASKTVVESLCLCWLLSTLLGHSEVSAFERGAMKELIGACGDPGSGVVRLFKRLNAVTRRILREDQDAAKLLNSLAYFEASMEKWRDVAEEMSKGVGFDDALVKVF